MERSVLHTSRLNRQLDGRYIALKINTDRYSALVERYHISSIPSDVILSPNGKLLTDFSGYQSLDSIIGRLSQTENRFAQNRKTRLNRSNALKPKFVSRKTKQTSPTILRTGLEGYSPISLWKNRRWVRGKKTFESIHEGFRYRFVSLAEKTEFLKNPDRYVPKLLGCDPVQLWKTDLAVVGSIRFGAYFDGELYLFRTADSRAEFRRNPLRYTKSRHVLKPNDIGGTVRN